MALTSLDQICQAAESAWPELSFERQAFIEFLADRDVDGVTEDGAGELALAFACGLGDEVALRLLDRRYLDVVPAALAHMRLGDAVVQDVRQMVREKLLIASGDEPIKLLQYAGQGKLRGLIQVVAVRTAISVIRKHKREVPVAGDELGELPQPHNDPGLAFMKARYRAEFKAVFQTVLQSLSDRERNLLRLHLLGGVTLDKLAEMYGVHRATIVRWLAKARKRVFSDTKRGLSNKLDISPTEFDSLMNLIQSRLDLSVSRMLRTLPSGEARADGPDATDRRD